MGKRPWRLPDHVDSPGRLAPGRWRFRMRPPLRPGASQPTLWPHPRPKPHPRPPRAPPDIPRPLPVPSAVHRPSTVHRHRPRSSPPSAVRSAVRHPHSFIRSPFVDGLPSPQQPRKPILRHRLSAVHRRPSSTLCPAVRGLRSAIHIRLFVPHSLTVCPPPASKAHPPPPAVRRLRSAVYLAVRRLLSLPLPQQRLIWPRPGRFTGKTIPPAQGVEQGR
jgi:hypothetical protein